MPFYPTLASLRLRERFPRGSLGAVFSAASIIVNLRSRGFRRKSSRRYSITINFRSGSSHCRELTPRCFYRLQRNDLEPFRRRSTDLARRGIIQRIRCACLLSQELPRTSRQSFGTFSSNAKSHFPLYPLNGIRYPSKQSIGKSKEHTPLKLP